jgi:BlaI family penicillinase repressor
MNEQIRISDAEWIIMDILWTRSPQTSPEIIAIASHGHDWSPKTVRTLIDRLVKKGALRKSATAQGLQFEPALSREQCVHSETQGFVTRVFGGMPVPFLSRFIESGNLTAQELAELRSFIEKKEKEAHHHD